jgi:hypothetical protein
MIITFDKKKTQAVVNLAKAYIPKPEPYYEWSNGEISADPVSGVVLVGDHGVYIMPHGADPKTNTAADGFGWEEYNENRISYALECDPRSKMSIETVYENKRRSFGPDDGVIFLPIGKIQSWIDGSPGKLIKCNLWPDSIKLMGAR